MSSRLDPRLAVDHLDHAAQLDGPVDALVGAVRSVLKPGPVKDALHGTWLGHPLHPMLTDLPIGCWTNAMLLDLVGGKRSAPAAQLLTGAGVLAALPTAAAGAADWSDAERPDQRTGLVHAASNTAALVLYTWSWLARRRGERGKGIVLGFVGAGAATVGGYLGGHLSYRRGTGVNRNAFHDPDPGDWIAVADEAAVPQREATKVEADGVAVLLYRDSDRLLAIADVCSHLAGPLHEGEVHDGCVTCPWHGSTFRLDDGVVVRGPAQAPQPVFDTKVEGGKVHVRRRLP